MQNLLYFSIAQYVPDILRDERINIGFVYFQPSSKKVGFIKSKNTNRILAFNDELDKSTYSLMLSSLEYDFSIDSFEYDDNEDLINHLFSLKTPELLEYKIKNYINHIQFKNISKFEIETSLESAIKDISDVFLYYDTPKSERKMNQLRVKNLTKKILESNLNSHQIKIAENKTNHFINKPYDFCVMGREKIFIKSLSIDYTTFHLKNEFKSFLFDIYSASDADPNFDKPIVVINNFESLSNEVTNDILKILEKENLKIIKLADLPNLINQINYSLLT